MSPDVKTGKEAVEFLLSNFNAQAAAGDSSIIQLCLSGEGGGDFYFTVDDGKATLTEGLSEDAECTLKAAASDYVDMTNGKLNGMKAFMTGKLKISGNQAILVKFQRWFNYSG